MLVLVALACGSMSNGAFARTERAAPLAAIEPGLWSLRMREGGASRRMCVRDVRDLIQLQHRQHACRQTVLGNDDDELTVAYSCAGEGFGRTHVRIESARLVHVESQGIAGQSPFEFWLEARRIGACDR